MQLLDERRHHPLQRAALGQFVPIKPDRVLIWCAITQIKTEEPHPGQPAAADMPRSKA